jgi:hypothetical protein
LESGEDVDEAPEAVDVAVVGDALAPDVRKVDHAELEPAADGAQKRGALGAAATPAAKWCHRGSAHFALPGSAAS